MDNDNNLHLNPKDLLRNNQGDSIQARLDSVNRRLARPAFLQDITSSRLPSQAASDSSISPGEAPPNARSFLKDRPGPSASSPLAKPLHLSDDEDIDRHDFLHKSWSIESAILEHDFKSPDRDIGPIELHRFRQLKQDFLNAWQHVPELRPNMSGASEKFSTFDHEHTDLVLAVDFNFYGNRMVTASSDHRLKVWDKRDENWVLIDSWRAHDAEVVDVKWNGPFTGSIIGSIGEDGHFRLWEEDVLQAPMSTRRFQKIQSFRSETKIPYCSLDFKNLQMETYVALITRDGYLSILEPSDHDNLASEWTHLLQKYVCPTPSRQEETGFRVSWHKEKVPCWTAVEAGLDRKSLGVAVAAMNNVKVYRTDKERKWYEAAQLTGATGVIRDIAWANGAMRGYDVIATASKDGAVRIYKLSTLPDQSAGATEHAGNSSSPGVSSSRPTKAAMSGIGAGLAGSSASKDSLRDQDKAAPGRVRHVVKKVAEMTAHGGSVWRVAFSQLGTTSFRVSKDQANTNRRSACFYWG